MMIVLLAAGIGFLLVGVVAIGFGIPINEFGFGNTLIVAGTVAACTGMLLIGLWTAIKELKVIARRLGPGTATAPSAASALQSEAAVAAARNAATRDDGLLLGSDQSGSENAVTAETVAPSSTPPPWHGEGAPRDRSQEEGAPGSEAEPKAGKQRRNLLFSSSARKERERAQARTGDPSAPDPHPEPPTTSAARESAELPPASFDDAWPKVERARGADVAQPRRAVRTPTTFAEPGAAPPGADRYPPAVREDAVQVTVLKSGVVDGMAYSLYSDGSIEAQMPEGMMRFASIDELRAHLDQRS